jgi:hypothetical protein
MWGSFDPNQPYANPRVPTPCDMMNSDIGEKGLLFNTEKAKCTSDWLLSLYSW